MDQKIVNKTLQLSGVTCAACEAKIESKLSKLSGVYKVSVSYVSSILHITFDENMITMTEIATSLKSWIME